MSNRGARQLGAVVCAALLIAACGGGSDAEPADTDDVEDADDVEDTTGDTSPDGTAAAMDDPPTTNGNDTTTTTSGARCGEVQEDDSFVDIDCAEPHDAEFAGTVAAPESAPLADEAAEKIRLTTACVQSVEDLTGRSTSMFGIDVRTDADLDVGTIDCWALATAEDSLQGSIADIGLLSALGEFRMLPDLEIGTCFVDADDDSYDLVFEVDCDQSDAQQLFAFVTLDDRDYPGEDAVVDEAFEKCDIALEASTLDLISTGYSIVFPEDPGWTAMAQRSVSCSAVRPEEETADDAPASGPNGEAVWETPSTFAWGVDEPICLNGIDDGDDEDNVADWYEVDCAGPHETEFLGLADPPFATLPNDIDEATAGLRDVCNVLLEAQTGQRRELTGLSLNFSAPAGLGEPVDGGVACMASVSDPFLVGSLQSADIDTVLGDIEILAELAPGTCFTFPGESTALGHVVSCDEPGAIMAVGTYTMAEYDPYPDIDDIRADRSAACAEVYEASGLSGDPSTLSGTFASRNEYLFDGERLATCDITPI